MVTALVSLFAAVWIVGLIVLVVSARRAPVGYEDATGFHAVDQTAQPGTMMAATVSVS